MSALYLLSATNRGRHGRGWCHQSGLRAGPRVLWMQTGLGEAVWASLGLDSAAPRSLRINWRVFFNLRTTFIRKSVKTSCKSCRIYLLSIYCYPFNMIVLGNAHYKHTFRGKLPIIKCFLCRNKGFPSKNCFRRANTHSLLPLRAAVNVPEINFTVLCQPG